MSYFKRSHINIHQRVTEIFSVCFQYRCLHILLLDVVAVQTIEGITLTNQVDSNELFNVFLNNNVNERVKIRLNIIGYRDKLDA